MIRNPLLLAAVQRYTINQSLRFRASNSARLSRTGLTAGTANRWAVSFWAKLGAGSNQALFCGYSNGNNYTYFGTTASNQLGFTNASGGVIDVQFTTTAVYRDPTAWYHVAVFVDTTLATASDRYQIWVNGTRVTSFATSTNTLAQNSGLYWNDNFTQYIGTFDTVTNYFDGYIAEFINTGRVATNPTVGSFGQFDPSSNSWVPRRYTGTYGTNGFYLPFNDATSTTTIGQDRSGNGNNWTSSGISVTAGATFDQMLDTPTNNFAVLNSLVDATTFGGVPGISAANLNSTGQNAGTIIPTFAMTTGKWYMEVVPTFSGGNHYFGVRRLSTPPTGGPWNETISSNQSAGWYDGAGNFSASGGASFSSGQTLGLTWDADAGTLTIRVNNTLSFTQTVAGWAGVPVVFTYSPSVPTGQSQVWNFGQRPFAYTPPTGFVALNTANLPTPTITNGYTGFNAVLRTGTGAAASVSSLLFQPDLVWIKRRDSAGTSVLTDSVRGTNAQQFSNQAVADESQTNALTAFNSNGYSLGNNNSGTFTQNNVNFNTATYVDWAWREGAAYGFDIVLDSGTSANKDVAHALNAVPHMMIRKCRNVARSWRVYHRNANASPASGSLILDSTATFTVDATDWNNTAPGSSTFRVGTGYNVTGENYVTYLWTSIPGFSLFGSYIGNGSTDGPFVWCGFRPRFVMIKPATAAESWYMVDAARNTFNVTDSRLVAESSAAEVATGMPVDFTANGFKLRTANGNPSGGTVIFAAFAETPFKTATAR